LVYLLDSHAFLWIVSDDPRLSRRAKSRFLDPRNDFRLSVASVWEISIKASLGKLTLPASPRKWIRDALSANAVALLAIEVDHAARVAELPFHHRDPFDRLLASQALSESLPLVSADRIFDRYRVDRVW
jgi:PIN domain nuclease of toxin-antitoxin system